MGKPPLKLRLFMKLSRLTVGSPKEQDPIRLRRKVNSRKTSWIRDKKAKTGGIEDHIIQPEKKLKVRVYTPISENNQRVVCYFHGGGFVIGGLNSHDNICRRLCEDNSVTVISVGYRQGPEFRFPAAQEDALYAVKWVLDNYCIDKQLILAGDSAGGNLAAYASLEFPGKISKQVLIYPVLDLVRPKPYNKIKYSFFNSEIESKWYASNYLSNEEERSDPRLSILNRSDLSNSPSTLILSAESDVFKYEGSEYAQKLQNEGVEAYTKVYKGMVHGFLNFPRWASGAEAAFQDIKRFISQPESSTNYA